jgi:hypothetical protein
MTHVDIGTTGAKRQSWYDNPREVLRRIVEKNPSWSRDRLFIEFKRIVEKKPTHLETIIEYWFSNNYHSLIERPDATERNRVRVEKTEQLRAALNEKIKEHAKIVLLDMLMPNGKKLRECTGSECKILSSKIGAWLLRLSKQMKPNEFVGDVLTETQVKDFYNRR